MTAWTRAGRAAASTSRLARSAPPVSVATGLRRLYRRGDGNQDGEAGEIRRSWSDSIRLRMLKRLPALTHPPRVVVACTEPTLAPVSLGTVMYVPPGLTDTLATVAAARSNKVTAPKAPQRRCTRRLLRVDR